MGKIILTNMCMVYNDEGQFLVQLRNKNDWPGINFPGGHIEENESVEESVIREMKEETGLTVSDLEFCDYVEWNVPSEHVRHLCLLFRTKIFMGDLTSSDEGKMMWIKKEDLTKYPLSTDFDIVLEKALKK